MSVSTGQGPAKGASSSSEPNPGDFATLSATLKQQPGSNAKELVIYLKNASNGQFDKKRVNAILYRMENAQLARRELRGETPYWFVA